MIFAFKNVYRESVTHVGQEIVIKKKYREIGMKWWTICKILSGNRDENDRVSVNSFHLEIVSIS